MQIAIFVVLLASPVRGRTILFKKLKWLLWLERFFSFFRERFVIASFGCSIYFQGFFNLEKIRLFYTGWASISKMWGKKPDLPLLEENLQTLPFGLPYAGRICRICCQPLVNSRKAKLTTFKLFMNRGGQVK